MRDSGLLHFGTGQTIEVIYNKETLLAPVDEMNSLQNATDNCSLQDVSVMFCPKSVIIMIIIIIIIIIIMMMMMMMMMSVCLELLSM